MMDQAIRDFPKQFKYEPIIGNADALARRKHAIAVGMGGSHLAADLLKMAYPEVDLIVHEDYDLPAHTENSMVILNSYSGNTEEVLDAYDSAEKKGLDIAVIATGGELLKRAKENGIAYVELPKTGIQPRSALGFHVRALMKLFGMEDALKETKALSETLDVLHAEKEGKTLAESIFGKVPVIYSSTKNRAVAYNWKIKFNETGKIPAFSNVFPELNHNEMAGFDVTEPTKKMVDMFHFIFLKDNGDHPRIQRRMDVCKKLYEDRGLAVDMRELKGSTIWEKIFSSLLIADWTSFYTAEAFGFGPEQVPMVEEFKKMI